MKTSNISQPNDLSICRNSFSLLYYPILEIEGDNTDIFATSIHKIWNMSLESSIWPSSWRRADVNPLPKVHIPKDMSDYSGINITPVIACAFEKCV